MIVMLITYPVNTLRGLLIGLCTHGVQRSIDLLCLSEKFPTAYVVDYIALIKKMYIITNSRVAW